MISDGAKKAISWWSTKLSTLVTSSVLLFIDRLFALYATYCTEIEVSSSLAKTLSFPSLFYTLTAVMFVFNCSLRRLPMFWRYC